MNSKRRRDESQQESSGVSSADNDNLSAGTQEEQQSSDLEGSTHIITDTMARTKKARIQQKIKSFPEKLMKLLNDKQNESVIRWEPDGESFVIILPFELTTSVLPRYFKESKFESFTRKLNRWGFQRIYRKNDKDCKDTPIYSHELFKRDKPMLCHQMQGTQKVRQHSEHPIPRSIPPGGDKQHLAGKTTGLHEGGGIVPREDTDQMLVRRMGQLQDFHRRLPLTSPTLADTLQLQAGLARGGIPSLHSQLPFQSGISPNTAPLSDVERLLQQKAALLQSPFIATNPSLLPSIHRPSLELNRFNMAHNLSSLPTARTNPLEEALRQRQSISEQLIYQNLLNTAQQQQRRLSLPATSSVAVPSTAGMSLTAERSSLLHHPPDRDENLVRSLLAIQRFGDTRPEFSRSTSAPLDSRVLGLSPEPDIGNPGASASASTGSGASASTGSGASASASEQAIRHALLKNLESLQKQRKR